MSWQQKIQYLVGQPIGVSFVNGQGTSGILCGASDGKLLVIEYLYQSQFALKQYDFYTIRIYIGFRLVRINKRYINENVPLYLKVGVYFSCEVSRKAQRRLKAGKKLIC